MVANLWRGRRPVSFNEHGRGQPERGASSRDEEEQAKGLLATRSLEIVALARETADAISLVLADPEGEPVEFVPGQFFTVLVTVDGEALRRAYSLSSCAQEQERVRITIKRVAGGKVSNYLNDHARVGQRLRVLGPSGAFTLRPDEAKARRLMMIAGGSGITPIMAILRSLLAVEPRTQVALLYGNRGVDDIIFKRELDHLFAAHADRLHVRHVLSRPPAGAWEGGAGLLDELTVERELVGLESLGLLGADHEYFVCGPEGMMQAVRGVLRARDVAPRKIHEERFSQPQLRPRVRRDSSGGDAAPADEPRAVVVRRGGLPATRYLVEPGQTVLEGGLASGVPLRYSCAMGGCGACKVTLAEGEVEMEEPNCLTAAERARGEVLACVCYPRTEEVVIELAGPRVRAPMGAHRR
jgi:ferredoxin-NADP reductase